MIIYLIFHTEKLFVFHFEYCYYYYYYCMDLDTVWTSFLFDPSPLMGKPKRISRDMLLPT